MVKFCYWHQHSAGNNLDLVVEVELGNNESYKKNFNKSTNKSYLFFEIKKNQWNIFLHTGYRK